MSQAVEEPEIPALTFAVPILPGKTEMWKQMVTEMVGPRKDESRVLRLPVHDGVKVGIPKGYIELKL